MATVAICATIVWTFANSENHWPAQPGNCTPIGGRGDPAGELHLLDLLADHHEQDDEQHPAGCCRFGGVGSG
jgi:hypothetical protein